MISQWNNQSQRSRSARLILTSSLSVALLLLSACEAAEESTTPDEPNEPSDPSCVEMGPSSSEACQQRGLSLGDESSCAQAECQMITYETTCSGSQEALCLMMDISCEAAPLSPELVCATEDLVLATEAECAEVECQQVSSSVCGETSSVLCRAADAICEEDGYPAPGSICEGEGLTLATEAECAEVMCQVVEFEIACGETAEVLCRAPGSTEPLPEQCAEREESQCGLDDACRWLIPEPWACAEPEELLPQAGCFPITSCRENGDCGEGEECRSVAFGECDQPGDVCEACATYDNLCLPVAAEPLPEKCADRDEAQCGGDDACQWLIPEPWACAEPEEILPEAGCFSRRGCIENADCDEGEECRSVAFGECDQPDDLCQACAGYLNLCLPMSGGEE